VRQAEQEISHAVTKIAKRLGEEFNVVEELDDDEDRNSRQFAEQQELEHVPDQIAT
jgi:hypothetical protein